MTTVVLDGTNVEAVLADARGEPMPVKAEEPREEPKVEEPKDVPHGTEPKVEEPTDEDTEGEDGLTPRQKRDLTQKMQVAIGKKHRALKDAEEFATEQYNERRMAEQRAEKFEREIQRLKAQVEPDKPSEERKPQRENFETEEKFRDALDDWRVDQKFEAKEAKIAKDREAERQAEIVKAASAKVSHAREVVPDFDEVVEGADIEVPPYIAGYMQESDMFAELGYHFAQHPEELAKLAKLSPARALVEVGKIESKLSPFPAAKAEKAVEKSNGATPSTNGVNPAPKPTETEPVAPSKPRAAAPITPLSSGTGTQVEKAESEMDAREALAAWSKKRHVNLTKRQRH